MSFYVVKHSAIAQWQSMRLLSRLRRDVGSEFLVEYSLYILRSISCGRFYVGSSQDPVQRLKYHNTIERGFTSRYRPWKIVYAKEYLTKREALEAERKVKRWKSREMIEKLVQGLIQV